MAHASNKADLLTKSSFAPTTFEKLKSMVMAPKATNVVSFTGVPLHMLVPGDGAGPSSDGDAAAPAAPPAVNPLLALAAATRAEALVAAEAAFERGVFDVAEARALAGAYGATRPLRQCTPCLSASGARPRSMRTSLLFIFVSVHMLRPMPQQGGC